MVLWPSWLWINTPLRAVLWLCNRLVTWTGLAIFWKRFRASRAFWVWMTLINAGSFGLLVLVFLWLHQHAQ